MVMLLAASFALLRPVPPPAARTRARSAVLCISVSTGVLGAAVLGAGATMVATSELKPLLASAMLGLGGAVLLVSHGGMLKQTFATDSFANSEFRCFDLLASGEMRPCEAVPHPLTS